MSRSKRQPIVKDRPRNKKKSSLYWRTVRRVVNDNVRKLKYDDEHELPQPQEIVNDYDYCDYVIDYRKWDNDKGWGEKLSRK
jgi:hypothetical protein